MNRGADAGFGAIYIITQDPKYLGLLHTSAASLKRAMPHLPITLFSQFPVETPYFDNVVPVTPTVDGFYDKTRLMRETPYERTLFIDADTYVVEAVSELFPLLDRFDCAATHEEYLNTDWHKRYERSDIPRSFPEFNTGVFLYRRSDQMDRLLREWGDLYKEYLEVKSGEQLNDQPFFRVAAYHSDVRIATLTREYNCKFRGQGYLNGAVKILHGHYNLELASEYVGRAARVLNASKKPRVYIAGHVYEQKIGGRLVSRRTAHKVGYFPELPESGLRLGAKRLKEVVRERGIWNTLARIVAR